MSATRPFAIVTGASTGIGAGFMPGSFQAVYNGTKAFLNSFVCVGDRPL